MKSITSLCFPKRNDSNHLNFASRLLLLGILFISPLLFGSVYLWSSVILEFGAFIAFIIYICESRQIRPSTDKPPLNIFFLPIALFLLFVALQMMPLSAAIFGILFPERVEFWQQPFNIFGRHPEGPFFLSFYPGATLVEFSRFLAYTLASYIAASLIQVDYHFSDRLYSVRSLTWVISLTGFTVSLVAILQVGLNAKAIYGFWAPLHSASFMGPYVNRNHLAGLLEMCLPMQLGLLTLQYIASHKPASLSRSSKARRWKSNIIILYLIFFVTLCGLILSLSRTGIIVGIFSLLIQTCLIMVVFGKKLHKKLIFLLSIFGLAILIGVAFSFDFDALTKRFQNISLSLNSNFRWIIARDSWNMFLSYPWLGTGLGSFVTVFPMFKSSNAQIIIEHAHQDYLEILTESGIIGALAFFSFFIQAFLRGVRQITRLLVNIETVESDKLQQFSLTLSAATSVLAILLHSFVDFNLRIPANALYFFILAGILLGLTTQHQDKYAKFNKYHVS